MCLVIRAGHRKTSFGLLMFAVISGWFYLLNFTQINFGTGRLVVIILQIFANDLMYFLVAWIVILLGFSTAFHITRDIPPSENGFYEYLVSCFYLIETSFGSGEWDNRSEEIREDFKTFAMLLWILYLVISVVLLLNLLIALMAETTHVLGDKQVAELIWREQWASTVLLIERRVPGFLYKRVGSREREKLITSVTQFSVPTPRGCCQRWKDRFVWCMQCVFCFFCCRNKDEEHLADLGERDSWWRFCCSNSKTANEDQEYSYTVVEEADIVREEKLKKWIHEFVKNPDEFTFDDNDENRLTISTNNNTNIAFSGNKSVAPRKSRFHMETQTFGGFAGSIDIIPDNHHSTDSDSSMEYQVKQTKPVRKTRSARDSSGSSANGL